MTAASTLYLQVNKFFFLWEFKFCGRYFSIFKFRLVGLMLCHASIVKNLSPLLSSWMAEDRGVAQF